MRTALVGGLLVAMLLPASAAAQDGEAVATVNGRPISKRKLVEVLMEGHGLSILQQLVVLELAREEATRLKLKVTQAEIEAEFQRAMDNIAPRTNEGGEPLDEAGRLQALDFLLQQRGLSMVEFKLGMERNAYLRRIVEASIKIDEPTLREEFARIYGEKVAVRSIQVSDQNGLYEALRLLDQGSDFADVARRVSQDAASASQGGLLAPFAFNDDRVAATLRQAAFELTPGQRTQPIKSGRWWFILKLERRIEPENVTFESTRPEVERRLMERVVPEQMNKLVMELYGKAQIRVLDRSLKDKWEELMKQNKLAPPVTTP